MPIDQTVSLTVQHFQTSFVTQTVQILITIAPVVLAFLLARIFWELWVDYVRGKCMLGKKYVVLELRLPKDTFKSPKAMEVFLNSIHNTSDGSFFTQYWKGDTRPWFSLELVSVEGNVKFYMWMEAVRKVGVMSALYSQYPEIEIKEVEDYTRTVHFDPKEIRIWAAEFAFTNKNKAYPIKTYIDYGLDKDPKEEFKVDPMLPLIEFMGSVGPNQQVWMQILVRAHKKDRRVKGKFFKKEDSWSEEALKAKNEIFLIKDAKTKVAGEVNPDTGYARIPTISEGEREVALAIERRISKHAFDVGIRFLYIAKKEIFDTPFAIGGIISSMKQFNDERLNGFKPNGDKWHPRLDDPWKDYKNMRRNRYGKVGLAAFKRRSLFYTPFQGKYLIMNTEEIATIYHFPGSVSQTPNLERVPSKRAQAPGNLPV